MDCPASNCDYESTEHGVKVHYGRTDDSEHTGTLADTYECEQCGEVNRKDNGSNRDYRYCSTQCKTVAESNYETIQELARNVWTKCKVCGKWVKQTGKYCSYECRTEDFDYDEINGTRTTYTHTCPECDTEFEARLEDRTYCSFSCRSTAIGRRREIDVNGNPFYQIPIPNDRRQVVYDRDNGRCLRCGMTQKEHVKKYEQRLSIHHIEPRVSFLKKYDDLLIARKKANRFSNLATLCKSCHSQVERETHPSFDKQTGV